MNRTMRLLRHKHNISYVELGKAADIIADGIALLSYAVGFDGYLFKQSCAGLKCNCDRK